MGMGYRSHTPAGQELQDVGNIPPANTITKCDTCNSQGVVGLNLVLSDKVFFAVESGSLGHG